MRDLLQRPDLFSTNIAAPGYKASLPVIIDACAARSIGVITSWRRELQGKGLQQIAYQPTANNMSVSGLCRSIRYTAPVLVEHKLVIDNNRRTLDDTAMLNATCCMQMTGSLSTGTKDLYEAREQVKQRTRRLLPHPKDVGVPIAPEPLHPMTAANRSHLCMLRQALDWCDEFDPDGEFGLDVVMDVHHVWWDSDLASQTLRAGKRILVFHIPGWLVLTTDLVNGRGMPGDGVISIPSIRRLIENAGFNGVVELEIFSPYWWQRSINGTLDISVGCVAHYCQGVVMSDQPVLFSRMVASCRLASNREDKCHTTDGEMTESLDHYLDEIEDGITLRLVESAATGDGSSCAGDNIKSWSAYSPLDMSRKWIKRGNNILNRLQDSPQLVIANLSGRTIGGSTELALYCGIRIARLGVKFSNPEVMLGMVPGWVGVECVPSQVDPVVGHQMLVLSECLTVQETQAANLTDEVVEIGQVGSWMTNQLAQLEEYGPVALAHIEQLILALENRHADYPHQLLTGLMSATWDCQRATRTFAKKSSVSSHDQ